MIKVNLLRDQTIHLHKRSPITISTPQVSGIGIILAALFGLAALGIGVWWYYLDNEIEKNIAAQSQLKAEEARLNDLRQQLLNFDVLRKERRTRIAVIENLKNSQNGPVKLLNTVVDSIPHNTGYIWLTSMEQSNNNIKFYGETWMPEILPVLMNNLTSSGFFASVDIEMLERRGDGSGNNQKPVAVPSFFESLRLVSPKNRGKNDDDHMSRNANDISKFALHCVSKQSTIAE